MPEIGPTLREARMRAGTDVSVLEAETKIRAKYLRALENEEWDLLPGPTYVKSFLRTYADALGLDGRLLVEEYKLRHERPNEAELRPIGPARAGERGRTRRAGRRRPGRGWAVGAVLVAIVGALLAIGLLTEDDGDPAGTPAPAPTTTAREPDAPAPPPARPRRALARLTLVATGEVFVCLRAGDRVLVPAETLSAGDRRGPFRARRFTMTFGNANVRMRVDGRARPVPASSEPIGYVVDRRGRRGLAEAARPTCGA